MKKEISMRSNQFTALLQRACPSMLNAGHGAPVVDLDRSRFSSAARKPAQQMGKAKSTQQINFGKHNYVDYKLDFTL